MKPGFVDGDHLRQSADRNSAARRPHVGPPARARAVAASPQNPLTARVIVNRLWQNHFGRGIVATLENFGKMGEPPTHPELLDWLAVEFMNRGWSIKQMHRLMMTSEAYQMASAFDDAATAREAIRTNRLPVALPPQRLDAEIVRDSMLAAGGNINLDDRRRADLSAHPERAADGGRSAASWIRTQPDGPRGVAAQRLRLSQARSLPYPMFDRSSIIPT